MSILEPSEWYAKQDLSKHYMRRTDRPFEEGVSRGQLRCLKSAKDDALIGGMTDVLSAYAVISDNRMAKGRAYGMRLRDCLDLAQANMAKCFHVYSVAGIEAAAFCVLIKPNICYVSGWANIHGSSLPYSPIPFLAKKIYEQCAFDGIDIMDIGIADELNLIEFKERLGFKLPTL